jgi:hypothetical protein
MIPISRSILLAAGLLAFSGAGAVAQQNDSPATGSAMKNAKPDTSGYTKPTATNPSADSQMKGATVGDAANKAAAGSSDSSKATGGGQPTAPSPEKKP